MLAIHELLIAEHGGPPGLRDENLLESALGSPRNLLAYGSPDLFDLAARYGTALVLNHPFRDGNKRIAFTVTGVFLEMNGVRLHAPEAEAVSVIVALATRELDADGFARWLREYSSPLPTPKRTKRSGPGVKRAGQRRR